MNGDIAVYGCSIIGHVEYSHKSFLVWNKSTDLTDKRLKIK